MDARECCPGIRSSSRASRSIVRSGTFVRNPLIMAIHAKLLAFQKQNITIGRDGINPHFKSSYTTLNEVLGKVKKPLNDAGVLIVQGPKTLLRDEAGVWVNVNGLLTQLIDTEDNSTVECFVPFVNATDMQKLGGAITYARRYSLIALLGLEDEDDDGNAASAKSFAGGKVDDDLEF